MMTIYRDMSRTGKLAGRAIAGQARAPGSRRAATPAPLRRDLDGEPAIDLRNQLARIAARVAHDPRLADAIVAREVRGVRLVHPGHEILDQPEVVQRPAVARLVARPGKPQRRTNEANALEHD